MDDLSEAIEVVMAALPRATAIRFEQDFSEDGSGIVKTGERLIVELGPTTEARPS
jgi:hypothetical protein